MRFLLIGVLLLSACSQNSNPASTSEPAPITAPSPLPAGMSRVADPSQVCMVNNMYMGQPQIPVQVEGRTYFGCCPDCKLKLQAQPATRVATDPVTGQEVDKASAIIVKDESGKVYYFASEDTLRRFRG